MPQSARSRSAASSPAIPRGSKAHGYDVIVSTTAVEDTAGKPLVRTLSFLTGIGIDADVEKIAKFLG
jgi:PTS system galactitol-specific IIB component